MASGVLPALGHPAPLTGTEVSQLPGRPRRQGTRGPAMVEKLFGDRVVTMSGMNRRQASGVFATAAITAPVSVFGPPAATANAATTPNRSALLPENGGDFESPGTRRPPRTSTRLAAGNPQAGA